MEIGPARNDTLRPTMEASTIFSLSSQASIFSGVTRKSIWYQCPVSRYLERVVSFSDASCPSRLESPTTLPPQPPTIRLHEESATGKVRPQKKSPPSTLTASREIS